MRKYLVLGLTLVVPLVVVTAPAQAQQETATSGAFSLTVHTHSENPETLLFGEQVDPLPFPVPEGSTDFAYSSRFCDLTAPFNDVGLNFNPDYAGIDDPAAVRHLVEGTTVDGDDGTVTGTITTVLCEGGEETASTITTSYTANFTQASADRAQVSGTFQITEGTGAFAGLTGSGRITGHFTCLDPETCAEVGVFEDAVFRLHGTYATV